MDALPPHLFISFLVESHICLFQFYDSIRLTGTTLKKKKKKINREPYQTKSTSLERKRERENLSAT